MPKIRRDFIYRDDTGRARLALESKRVGDRIAGPGGVVLAERVIPAARHSPPHLFGQGPRRQPGRRLVYLSLRGVIFWAEETGRPASGSVAYKKMWPVLRDNLPVDADVDVEGLVERILNNNIDAQTDMLVIEEYLVRADNLFVFGQNAWFADRFYLYTGVLANGKDFRGTVKKVAGVPRDNDPGADYNHIIRCWVYREGLSGGYRMLTEERVMRSSGLRRGYENNRAVINEYVSDDLADWTFSRTVGEDVRIDPKDSDRKTPIPGLPVNYLPRIFLHRVSSGESIQDTELSERLGNLYPQPGEIYMENASGGYRAYLNRFGVNTTWTSGDGLVWDQESTLNDAYSRQGDRVGGTWVVSLGRRT
jgi:hypothetical protein